MAKIINLPCVTSLDLPVDRILEMAGNANLSTVVVLGWEENGGFYFASSVADGGEAIWLLEKAKKALLEIGEE